MIVAGCLGVIAIVAARNAAAIQPDTLSSPLPSASEDGGSAVPSQIEPTPKLGMRVPGSAPGPGDQTRSSNVGLGIVLPAVGKAGAVTVMDSILNLDVADHFQVRRGRLLLPSDRSNLSGPFLMSPPGAASVYSAAGAGGFIGPNTGAIERDDGLVAFGNCIAGRARYFLGVFNLDHAKEDLLFSGGFNVALWGTERGSWDNSRYGDGDVVTLGGGFQHQRSESGRNGLPDSSDYANANIVMGDLLAEKTLASAGTLSLEATYYHFDAGESTRQTTYILASLRTPDYGGMGRVQPLLRWHQTSTQSGGTKRTMLDAFVTYMVHGYDLRVTAGYQRTNIGYAVVGNAIQAGLQMRK